MKKFLKLFVFCFIGLAVFVMFGGWVLFDFSQNLYVPVASIAFCLALLITCLDGLYLRVEALEKKIAALEQTQITPDETAQKSAELES